jgi:hypothetical protein
MQDILDPLESDARLRAGGFTIHSRPRTGPNVWRTPDGQLVPEDEARRRLAEAQAVQRTQGRKGARVP